MTTTSDTTNAIIKYLLLQGHLVWRNQTIGKVRGQFYRNKKGTADIVGFMKPSGRGIAIEYKGEGDRMSEEQKKYREDVLGVGAIHIVVDNTFEDFELKWKQTTAPTGMLGDAQGTRDAVKG